MRHAALSVLQCYPELNCSTGIVVSGLSKAHSRAVLPNSMPVGSDCSAASSICRDRALSAAFAAAPRPVTLPGVGAGLPDETSGEPVAAAASPLQEEGFSILTS